MYSPNISLRDSIQTNPSNAAIAQSSGSSDWLWAVFAVLVIADICVIGFHFRRANGGHNLLHQLAIIILSTAALAYFAMASNLGGTPITPEFHVFGTGTTRAIWYVRYIMWFICAPVLLLMVYIGTGFPLGGAFTALFMACFAVVCGLLGALVRTSYKWGFFAMGVMALVYVITHMLMARNVAFPSPTGRTRNAHRGAVGPLSLLALIYPIAWGLCEGGNRISVVGEMIWYGILDLLIFAVFVPYFLWSHRNVAFAPGMGYGAGASGAGTYGPGAGTTVAGNAYPGKAAEAGVVGHGATNATGAPVNNGVGARTAAPGHTGATF